MEFCLFVIVFIKLAVFLVILSIDVPCSAVSSSCHHYTVVSSASLLPRYHSHLPCFCKLDSAISTEQPSLSGINSSLPLISCEVLQFSPVCFVLFSCSMRSLECFWGGGVGDESISVFPALEAFGFMH